jgi:hypothetical protein
MASNRFGGSGLFVVARRLVSVSAGASLSPIGIERDFQDTVLRPLPQKHELNLGSAPHTVFDVRQQRSAAMHGSKLTDGIRSREMPEHYTYRLDAPGLSLGWPVGAQMRYGL